MHVHFPKFGTALFVTALVALSGGVHAGYRMNNNIVHPPEDAEIWPEVCFLPK